MHNVNNVCVNLLNGTLPVGTSRVLAFKVPSDAIGGGITLTSCQFASNAAIAAASAPVYELVNLSSTGAISGTLTTVLGSANWTAGTPRTGTISTAFVDADNYVAVQWKQTAVNADTPVISAVIGYLMGK